MNLNERQDAPTQSAAAGTPVPTVEEEIDAAFAEFVTDDEAPANKAAADDVLAGETDGSLDEDPAPADKAAAEPPAAGDEPPAGQDPSKNDIWANAPPELRAAHEAAQRDANLRLEGIRGRQSASDREVERLRRELEQLKGGASDDQTQEQKDDAGAKALGMESEQLKQLREDYPEVAGPLLDVISGLTAKIGQLEKGVGKFEDQELQSHLNAQEQLLTERHGDWKDVGADDRFAGWLQNQPKAIRDAMERNFHAIVDAEEAALVVGKFKTDMGIASATQAPQNQPDPLQQKRERQKQAGRDAGRSGPPAAAGIPEDIEAAADYWLSK